MPPQSVAAAAATVSPLPAAVHGRLRPWRRGGPASAPDAAWDGACGACYFPGKSQTPVSPRAAGVRAWATRRASAWTARSPG